MTDPIAQFRQWFGQAQQHAGIPDATAMTLATATAEGKPSARIVLLKAYDERGFSFYTNLESRKGEELAANPQAALVFYWAPLDQQVRIEGRVSAVQTAEADAYFASRERERQLGAWASQQSRPLDARATLESKVEALRDAYTDRDIPRPPHWSGWRLTPEQIEFWHQRDGRLHERDLYEKTASGWAHRLLYP